MVQFEQIQEFVDKIAEIFHPDKIILFGSYAYGTATEDSDVDILVIMPFEGHPAWKSVEILEKADYLIPKGIDLIVRTKEVVKQRLEWHDFFIMDIIEKGKVMYESSSE